MKHPWFKGVNWDKVMAKKIKSPYVPDLKGNDITGFFDSEFTDLRNNNTLNYFYIIRT